MARVGLVLVSALACVDAPGAPPAQPAFCSAPAPSFTLGPFLAAPRANRGMAVWGDALVGWDENVLIRATSPTEAEPWVPGVVSRGGMGFVEDGSLVVTEHNQGSRSLLRVSPAGGTTVLMAGIGAYGVVVGPDGLVYATTDNTVLRVDPGDLGSEVLVTFPDEVLPRVADFDPSGRKLYIGTRRSDGQVFVVDLDEDLQVATIRPFARTPGWVHDVLVVDACGNLLVTTFFGTGVYRITPDGTVTTLAELAAEDHVHGAAWGEGVGAWDDHTLYLAHPERGSLVSAWPLGVPSRRWTGE
jgi:sugar lactone lactonase YvrE